MKVSRLPRFSSVGSGGSTIWAAVAVWILSASSAWGLSTRQFAEEQSPAITTDSGIAEGSAVTFAVAPSVSLDAVSHAAQRALAGLLKSDTLSFAHLVRTAYRTDAPTPPAATRDVYFDTRDLRVLRNDLTYRLRYRWDRAADARRFRWLPFLAMWAPSDCRLEFGSTDATAVVTFRHGAWLSRQLKPPCSETGLVELAARGRIEDRRLGPAVALARALTAASRGDDAFDLAPTMTVTASASQLPVSARNPWGAGATSDLALRAVLVRLRVAERSPAAPIIRSDLLELRVEPDRDLLGRIQLIASLEDGLPPKRSRAPNPDVAKEAAAFSDDALEALRDDATQVRSALTAELSKLLGPPLPPANTYAQLTGHASGVIATRPTSQP